MNCSSKNWLKRQSLVFKISMSVLLCSFLGILVLSGIIKKRSEAIITEQILKHSNIVLQTAVSNISHLIFTTEQALRNLRNTLSQVRANDVESIRIALNSTIKTIYSSGLNLSHVSVYASSATKSSEGTLYSAFAKNDKFVLKSEHTKNFSKKFPWIAEVIKKDYISWSEPYLSPNSPESNMVITGILPFNFQEQESFQSLVSVSIDVKDIQKYIKDTPFHDMEHLILLSKKGLYINHPDPDINLKSTIYELSEASDTPQLSEIGQNILAGQTGTAHLPASSVFNQPTVLFYAPIPDIDWGVCLIFPQKDLFKPIHDLQIIIIFSALSVIFIILFLINKICHYSTKPLQNLSQIAEQYGKGNFSEHIPEICSNDEIGTLSAAFYNMRKNLLIYVQREKLAAIEQQKNVSELEISRQIQTSVLPVNFPKHQSFDIYGLMLPSHQIGGDFYDFFFLNKSKIALVIADVSGKGISAALFMMRAQEIIRQVAQYAKSVPQIFNRVNNILCKGNTTCMFVTAFFAVIDLKTGKTEYVNAGHLSPFLIEVSDCHEIPSKRNIALGAREKIFYTSGKINLPPGSTIFLYTDGITEAENPQRIFYGQARLQRIVSEKQNSAKNLVESVMSDMQKFTKGVSQSDDMTMLAFHYKGSLTRILSVQADTTRLSEVLDYICHDMKQNKLGQNIRKKIIVIAAEVFTNIALYSYKSGGEVSVKTALQQDYYSLTFTDHGKPYNPLEFKEPDINRPLGERTAGGLGIFLARKMADSLEYDYKNGKNILKASLFIKKT